MKKMMNGKNNNEENENFEDLFVKQIEYQNEVLEKRGITKVLPVDDIDWFSYHMQAMMEELGEVLKADKRWKTHRNERYVQKEKLDELADVFITAINMCIYSDIDCEEITNAIAEKIKENNKRLRISS